MVDVNLNDKHAEVISNRSPPISSLFLLLNSECLESWFKAQTYIFARLSNRKWRFAKL